MMNSVQKHEIPQDVADHDRPPFEESARSVEILRLEFLNATDGIAVYPREARTQLLNFARAIEAWRFRLSGEGAVLDRETSVGLRFREVPGDLAEGAAFGIGTDVVDLDGQRLEKLDCLGALAFPHIIEILELGFHWIGPPPTDLYAIGFLR